MGPTTWVFMIVVLAVMAALIRADRPDNWM